MDFHHDDSAFDSTSTGEVHQMYVPGSDDHSLGGDNEQTGYDGDQDSPGNGAGETVSVNVGGHRATAQATADVDHDGTLETAVVVDSAGHHIAISDLDGDGNADHAALLDDSGRVVDAAHLDRTGGRWVEDRPGDRTPYGSILDKSGASTHSTGAGPAGAGPGTEIEVGVGGQTTELPADYDLDDDGRDETAVVEGADGTKIAFTDTDGDGSADRATVFDGIGNLVGTAYYDPATGSWLADATP